MSAAPRAARGLQWERHAADFLAAQGLGILHRRYRCRLGEIDLICSDRDVLVFVEVRARGRGARVGSAESIDVAKRGRLVATARHYLARHPGRYTQPMRFDVVAIDAADTARPRLDWLRNVIEC